MRVELSAHATRQLEELGEPAEAAVEMLRSMTYDELAWSAESLPPQRGREIWMLWAGSVRVLLDTEDDEACIQGFGLTPRGRW